MFGRIQSLRLASLGLVACVMLHAPVYAAFSYPGCADLQASDFREVVITNFADGLLEPVGFSVGKDGRIFIAERTTGNVKTVSKNGEKKLMGKFDVYTKSELGLRFVTPDPNFAVNRWLYLFLNPLGVDVSRLMRVKVKDDWTLDMASVKIILDMPWTYGICCHTGGAMAWDSFGNLFVSTGNNKRNSDKFSVTNENSFIDDNQAGSANTNDYRGKILRIKPIAFSDAQNPTPGIGRTYSIPKGNLKEYYRDIWTADEAAKVLPEIYTMGHRNPYSINVDPYTGWLAWGDIGPDAAEDQADRGPAGNDEFDITDKPIFAGWPYFIGTNRAYKKWDYTSSTSLNTTWDVNAPMNESKNNTGAKRLPPAIPSILPESKKNGVTPLLPGGGQTCAITGPIYRYDGSLNSTVKLPPHFDGKWFIGEFRKNWVKVVDVEPNLSKVNGLQDFPLKISWHAILGMDLGPEGALYVLDYAGWADSSPNTRISRIEYTGTCLPKTPVPQYPVSIHTSGPDSRLVAPRLGSHAVEIPAGMRGVEIYDLRGRMVWKHIRTHAGTAESIELPSSLDRGVLKAFYVK